FFFFSSRRRHTRFSRDWSSDVCSSDLEKAVTFDWLCGSGVATASECATMRQRLDVWRSTCQNIRPEDGDQTIGCYFGRVAYAFAIGRASCRERVESTGFAVSLQRQETV